jgi:hypothetical protein
MICLSAPALFPKAREVLATAALPKRNSLHYQGHKTRHHPGLDTRAFTTRTNRSPRSHHSTLCPKNSPPKRTAQAQNSHPSGPPLPKNSTQADHQLHPSGPPLPKNSHSRCPKTLSDRNMHPGVTQPPLPRDRSAQGNKRPNFAPRSDSAAWRKGERGGCSEWNKSKDKGLNLSRS